MTIKLTTMALMIAAGSLLANAAHAASFDCAKARAKDEKAICANRALNDLDVKVTVLLDLDSRLVAMGQRGAIHDDQVVWLKARHLCGADTACLRQSYDKRIAVLDDVFQGVASHGPF